MNNQFVLPPTETWQIRSTMRIDAFSGTQGIGTGSGFFDIQIIPEPASLLPLGAGILLLRRRVLDRSWSPFSLASELTQTALVASLSLITKLGHRSAKRHSYAIF